MPGVNPAQSSSRGGIHLGDVGGNVEFSAGGDIVGGDKIVTITTTIQISAEVVTTRPLIVASPYRGLDRFEDRHTALFFGRDQLIKSLLTQLNSSAILLVLGASGSGKSSLVRAGLLPAHSKLFGSSFRYFVLVPDVNPFESLRSSLISGGFSQSETKTLLGSEPEALAALVQRLNRSGNKWLLFIDQFEEIFTQTEESLREKFIAALVAIIREPANSTKVILAMRADFLERLSPFPEFAKLVEKNIDLVTDMHPDELRLAIEQPAAHHGVVFQQGLVEEIIKDVQGQAGSLPLLQYTLTLLWEEERKEDVLADRKLNTKAYRELGGVRGALQKRADEIYASFSDSSEPKSERSQQAIVRQIFLRLVDIATEGTGDAPWRPVRRRVPIGSFQREEKVVLSTLVDQKLLVSNREKAGATDSDDAAAAPEATIEVAHEALFSCWERLKDWIDAAKHVIFVKNRLADDAGRWKRIYAGDAGAAEDELWAGSKLEEALGLRARHEFVTIVGGLTEVESRFLDLSAAQRDKLRQEQEEQRRRELEAARKLAETESKARRRQRFFIIGLVVLLAVAGLVAVIAVHEGNSARAAASAADQATKAAQEQAKIAESRRLAAESTSVLTKYPQRSVLLAVQAVKVEQPLHGVRVVADEQSLREALGFIGGRLIARADGPITTVAISPDNRWVVTGSSDNTARLWDLSAKDPAANSIVLRGHEEPVRAVAISPDNRWVVTGSLDKTARLWALSAKDPAANPIVLRHESWVSAVAISPDNRWVVTGSDDKTARLWDLSAKDPAANPIVLRGHESAVYTVAISPDNRWVVTGSSDKTARLWDLSAKDPAANSIVLRGHDGEVYAVAISPDNRWVVTGSDDKTARLWDLSAKDPAANPIVLRGHESAVYRVAISPDNRWVVTGSLDNTARLWDLSAKDPAANPIVLRGHDGDVRAVAISPDNRWVVTGSDDKTARLWALSAKDPAANPIVLRGHDGDVRAVAISPDNRWVVTGSYGQDGAAVGSERQRSGCQPRVLGGHEGAVFAVAISPDNRWVVTGSLDKTARLWDLSAKDPAANPIVLRGHEGAVYTVAISPDNRWVVTGSDDYTARLWDLSAKDPAANPIVLRGHEGTVYAVAISPDNRWVVTGSLDKTARLWDLSAKDPAANPGFCAATRARSLRWRSARITAGWSPEAMTRRRGCGI